MSFKSFKLSVLSFKPFLSIKKSLCLVIVLLISILSHGQYKIPERPADSEQTFVYDYSSSKLLSENEQNELTIKLKQYADTTSTQIVIAIINTTEGEDINFLGAEWGHKWGIGQEKEDNGVLILLAKDDRKLAISTGYGVEHLLTDAVSKQIIENDIVPYFKQSDYFGGLDRGTDAIFEVLKGEYKGTPKSNKTRGFPKILIPIIIIIIFIIINRNRGNRGGGGIWMGTYGSGGFGGYSSGGFSGGGGFGGGFGGGSFGGGGSSGGW